MGVGQAESVKILIIFFFFLLFFDSLLGVGKEVSHDYQKNHYFCKCFNCCFFIHFFEFILSFWLEPQSILATEKKIEK